MPDDIYYGQIPFTLRLDQITFEKIKIIAKRERRSANAQYEYFLIQAVAQYEQKNGIIEVDPNDFSV